MEGELKVLNANIGRMNIISDEKLNNVMVDTFDQIKNILTDHCGPFGNFAILTDPTDPTNVAIHTKDGINIVRQMYFASPMQEFIRKTIMYIGERAEHTAGDATTASMTMSASALKVLINKKIANQYTYQELVSHYTSFVEMVKSHIKKHKYTIENIKENLFYDNDNVTKADIISSIAYNQAYTSSHGNVKLASAMSEVFKYIPEVAWDYVGCQRSRYETDENITLEWDDYQYSLPSQVLNNDMLNKHSNTAYSSKIANLIIVPFEYNDTSLIYSKLLHYMDTYDNKKDLIILTSTGMSGVFYRKITEFCEKNNKAVVFQHHITSSELRELEGIALVSGYNRTDITSELLLVKNVSCDYSHKLLQFNNLYVNNNNDMINPNCHEGDIADKLEEIEKTIKLISVEMSGRGMLNKIVDLRRYYLKLYLTRRAVIKIGGNAHDNSGLVDIVMDTICATRSALKHGFVFTQNYTLRHILLDIKKDARSKFLGRSNIYRVFSDAFISAIDDYRKSIFKYRHINDGINKLCNKPNIIFNLSKSYEDNKCIIRTIKKEKSTDSIVKRAIPYEDGLIIQPANVDEGLLTRFGEVMLKFLKSSRVIMPEGVVLDR